ncbi:MULTISPECIES: sensor histidine kinase [unclassified Nocardioides]|uniref:sensor histidine kinase n=1 Tax=unclassified Nocardioides TaxID=2615069 RepID=UPI0009F095D9|nr:MULTISPECIES: ATP-binding protein [unclassified Nocardioides]GAW51813.1 PAS/PAC sensor signal transduction histidine kinase [Nocardioides sp. PD653-B2]GAW57240.1 PAS/PAC sensor signal transduction histidine kinase [Nocardioides sp. PD653]
MDQVSESEQLWRLTMEHSPIGMTLVGQGGELLVANRAFCEMLGYPEQVLRTMTFQEITYPEDLAADLALLEETLAGARSSYRIRKRYIHADGHLVWGDLSVALLRSEDGSPIHFISQILDVTAQQEYERRLAVAAEMLDHQRRLAEAVYDSVDVGLVLIDRSGRYETMNRRHRDFMALAFPDGHEGLAGQTGAVYGSDGVARLSREEMPTYRASQGEEFDDVRMWIGDDTITRRALSVSARTVHDQEGGFAGAALAYTDVTDFMRALDVKDEFVASVSHELRTPLTAVLGHLELLADRTDLPADMAQQVRVIERNAVRLRHLVGDLLHVAQVRDSGLQLARSAIDLRLLVQQAVEAAIPSAQAARVTLLADAADDVVAMVDGQRLRQVVDNLISNALKYSDGGGSITVSLQRTEDLLDIAVTDTGIGIDEAELDRLFTRFFRGQQAQVRMAPGAGLGLSIVQSIVQAHGGRVQVESEVGVGSRFRVLLPYIAP